MMETLEDARRARLAGRYGEAELICRRILDRDPINALAAGLLGQCLAEMGDPDAAREFIDLALSLAPENADVRINVAALREHQQNLADAIAEAQRATELESNKFEAWATLGKLLGKNGAFAEAAAALTTACRLNPGHPGAALLLAGASLEVHDFQGAKRALDLVDAVVRDLPDALKLRSHVARATNDWGALVEASTRWMEAAPNDEEPRIALAFGLGQLGYHQRAAETYRPLAEVQPPRAEHLAALGRYCLGARDLGAAKRWFERALEADPACADAAFGLSRLMTFAGDLTNAEAMARRALDADSRHADAYGQLAEITSGRLTDVELANLDALCRDDSLEDDVSAIAHFALGDALHQRKRVDEAFAAWSEANRLKVVESAKSPGGGYSFVTQERKTKRLMEWFSRDPALTSGAEGDSMAPTPIFIVGMPRSGTTLLESAIAAHPMVEGGGELPALPFILDEFLASRARGAAFILDKEREAWRQLYFNQVRNYGLKPSLFLTDKQPSNFMSIGFIRHVFPEAKIIHIRRDPVETGFSIFRRNFSQQWPYANDLETIGHYYGQYARLMAHWETSFPNAFISVQYEDLVENFEAELRRLLAYCGLPWDEACVNFHAAERPVITFSAVQVRKPASKDHLGSTRAYAKHLVPLKEALEAAGIDLATGRLKNSH